MAVTKIHGELQVQDATIKDAQIHASAAIVTTKLADGAEFIQRDGSVAFTADQSHGSNKITNVTDPTANQDAATKKYVDDLITGLKWKQSVVAATTGAETLATAFENGDTIDGVVLATGERILIKDQAAGAENGIYTVNGSGAPTRATDFDTGAEALGAAVFVEEGTANADSGWVCTNDATITIGSTALVFAQFDGAGSITAGAGMTKSGSTIDVIALNASMTINADDISVNLDGPAGTISLGGAGLQIADGTAGEFLIAQGGGTDTAFKAMSGDATLSAAGALTIVGGFTIDGDFVDDETPGGAINGSNTSFTLANTPSPSGSLQLFLNGIVQDVGAGNDFTISGLTITYLAAPQTGSKLLAWYRKGG